MPARGIWIARGNLLKNINPSIHKIPKLSMVMNQEFMIKRLNNPFIFIITVCEIEDIFVTVCEDMLSSKGCCEKCMIDPSCNKYFKKYKVTLPCKYPEINLDFKEHFCRTGTST